MNDQTFSRLPCVKDFALGVEVYMACGFTALLVAETRQIVFGIAGEYKSVEYDADCIPVNVVEQGIRP